MKIRILIGSLCNYMLVYSYQFFGIPRYDEFFENYPVQFEIRPLLPFHDFWENFTMDVPYLTNFVPAGQKNVLTTSNFYTPCKKMCPRFWHPVCGFEERLNYHVTFVNNCFRACFNYNHRRRFAFERTGTAWEEIDEDEITTRDPKIPTIPPGFLHFTEPHYNYAPTPKKFEKSPKTSSRDVEVLQFNDFYFTRVQDFTLEIWNITNCDCPRVYIPVCASNGKTFTNICWMNCRNWQRVDHAYEEFKNRPFSTSTLPPYFLKGKHYHLAAVSLIHKGPCYSQLEPYYFK